MIKFPFIALFALLFLKFVSRKQTKTFLISLISPLSIFAQNGESGGGSSGEILFYLFVLGFLVSLVPKRNDAFERKAMRVIKVWILLTIIPNVARAQTAAILRGDVLPDFSTAIPWRMDDTVPGYRTARVDLPILDACEKGRYSAELFFYKADTLFRYGKIDMICWRGLGGENLSDESRERFSTSTAGIGNGRFYAVVRDFDCGYAWIYDVFRESLSFRIVKLDCN